jgi:hypothetical protein
MKLGKNTYLGKRVERTVEKGELTLFDGLIDDYDRYTVLQVPERADADVEIGDQVVVSKNNVLEIKIDDYNYVLFKGTAIVYAKEENEA